LPHFEALEHKIIDLDPEQGGEEIIMDIASTSNIRKNRLHKFEDFYSKVDVSN